MSTWGQKQSYLSTTKSPSKKLKHAKCLIFSLLMAFSSLSAVSCSDNDIVNSSTNNNAANLGALNYFPVDVGFSASFVVTDANGVEIRRESYSADSAVFFDGHNGVNWVQRDLATSSVLNRGVMHWNSDRSVLYHSEDSSLRSQRLLSSPIEVEAQWPRWHDPIINTGNGITIGSGSDLNDENSALGNDIIVGDPNGANLESNDSKSGNSDPGANPQLSSFPTQGASTFYVTEVDNNLSVNGKSYEDCIQIINANSNQTVNRYWYCQGVGLVKFALNCKPQETVGSQNGALLN